MAVIIWFLAVLAFVFVGCLLGFAGFLFALDNEEDAQETRDREENGWR